MHAYQVFFSLLLLLVSESPVLVVVPEGVPQPEADLDLVHGQLGLVEHLRCEADSEDSVQGSAANRLIGEVVQSRRRPLLGPSPG